MRTTILVLGALGFGACDGAGTADCTEFEDFEAFLDNDGDGFGFDTVGRVCVLETGMVLVAGDCNDADATKFPGAEEVCNGIDDNCAAGIDEGFELKQYWFDDDRDGFGSSFPSKLACEAGGDEWVRNTDDCDDTSPTRNPDAPEICNEGIDDDCDELSDEDDPDLDLTTRTRFHADLDLDGYGNPSQAVDACVAPLGTVLDGTDCNDAQPAIHPDANEVCNGGIDDDCDQMSDDGDPSLDTSTWLSFYSDLDKDGFGGPDVVAMACAPQASQVANGLDCNDNDSKVNPNATEALCDLVDNDCDLATTDDVDGDFDGYMLCIDDCNDASDLIHPDAAEIAGDGRDQDCNGFESCYVDNDGDGFRTDVLVDVSVDPYCSFAPSVRADLPVDCDDTDAAIAWSGNWADDGDQDGVGAGATVLVQCADPGPAFAPDELGDDCDDLDPLVNPFAVDPCDDGVDYNCDGTDTCLTCKDIMESGATVNATYTIFPLGVARKVWCDLTTDGGGWTMVGGSNSPLDDASGPYHDQLVDLSPSQFQKDVWDGLRQRIQTNSDIRFACNQFFGGTLSVDLSFYDNPWYIEITTAKDADSCFNENEGLGADVPPARQDNVKPELPFRPYGDAYAAGFLEGEDSCTDTADFAVDFDDRGMAGVQWDDTNWGEANGIRRCKNFNMGSGWFLFVRELD